MALSEEDSSAREEERRHREVELVEEEVRSRVPRHDACREDIHVGALDMAVVGIVLVRELVDDMPGGQGRIPRRML
jgi:uncharacterized membrane protein